MVSSRAFLKIHRDLGKNQLILIYLKESAPSNIGRMPESCNDLHKIGHRKSGLFSVMGNKQSTTSTVILRSQPTMQVKIKFKQWKLINSINTKLYY